MSDTCHNCGATEPAKTTRSGAPIRSPGWSRHKKGAVACGPYCAGQLAVKRNLNAKGWTTPETPN